MQAPGDPDEGREGGNGHLSKGDIAEEITMLKACDGGECTAAKYGAADSDWNGVRVRADHEATRAAAVGLGSRPRVVRAVAYTVFGQRQPS